MRSPIRKESSLWTTLIVARNTRNINVVINLIKGNRTRIDGCTVTGIGTGYDVYGGGADNAKDGTHVNGMAGGFVGYNHEGKLLNNNMVYCDVVRGTAKLTGPFSGKTDLNSVYNFNTINAIEGENNTYAILMTTRYKRERQLGNDKRTAVTTALETSIPSIVVSAMGLFAATVGVAIYSDVDMIGSLCALMARGAIISMFCVILILPAMFMLFDKLIGVTTIGFRAKKSK